MRWLAGLFGIFVLQACSCSGSGSSGSPTPLQQQVAVPGNVPPSPISRGGADASVPQPGPCPTSAPVACASWCCPSGTSCSDAGCQAPPSPAACAVSGATVCGAAPTCSGGNCVVRDFSALGNDGSSDGGFAVGRFGSGIASRADCTPVMSAPTRGFPVGDGELTLEWWEMPNAAPSTIWFGGYGGASFSWSNGAFVFAFTDADGGADQLSFGISGGQQWNQWVFRYQAGTGALFFNGNRVGTHALSEVGASALGTASGTAFVLGGAPGMTDGGCQQTPGVFDEVRVLSRSLSDAEIQSDWAANAPFVATPDTVALWHFDEGASLRCCAAGTTCAPDGLCALPGTSTTPTQCGPATPVDCGNFTCCPSAMSCVGGSCEDDTVPGSSCPLDHPVSCTDATCCPNGFSCGDAGFCDEPPQPTSATISCPIATCPSGTSAFMDGASHAAAICCPSVQYNNVTAYDGTPNCGPTSQGWPASCYSELNSSGACSPGYGTVPYYSGCTCIAEGNPVIQCWNAGDSFTWTACEDSAGNGGCCPAGYEYNFAGGCQLFPCGSGYCPADGSRCDNKAQLCSTPSVPRECDGGALCGFECCGSNEACVSLDGGTGSCVVAVTSACPASLPVICGSTCCPSGAVCVAPDQCELPDDVPSCPSGQAPCGAGGVCCDSTEACQPDGTCALLASPAGHTGPQGPGCGPGAYCDVNEVCDTGDECCPQSDPTLCGDACCPTGTSCGPDGLCTCPSGEIACGASCCPTGNVCVQGQCMTQCAPGTTSCGAVCCEGGASCADPAKGECACPPETPTPCGTACCGPDATCTSKGCACNDGHNACGNQCCPSGQVCQQGQCANPPSCNDGEQLATCPDNSVICCSVHMVCCHDSANGDAIGCEFAGFCD